jgi:hypothetical protein
LLLVRPIEMQVNKVASNVEARVETYFHAEQQRQEERHRSLKGVCLGAGSPVERDFVRDLWVLKAISRIFTTLSP